MKPMAEQVSMFSPDSWSGKTSLGLSAPTEVRTSGQSWKKLAGLQNRPLLFLDMRGGGGQTQELLSETDIPSLGELTTRNIGEYPRGGVASLWSPTSTERLPRKSCLSAILETNPNPKYNLSPTACLGILRRAVRRGKISTMPKILIRALQRQAGVSLSEITMTEESSMTNLSRSTLVGGDRQPIIFKRG